MKNSLRTTVGVAAIMLAATGLCFGQSGVKLSGKGNDLNKSVVNGMEIKPTGMAKQADGIVVKGKPLTTTGPTFVTEVEISPVGTAKKLDEIVVVGKPLADTGRK